MTDTKTIRLTAAALLLAAVSGAETGAGSAASDQPATQSQPADTAPSSSAGADNDAKRRAVQERMKAALSTTTPVGPFVESTTVDGKIPVDLRGVWLLVAHAKVGEVDKVSKFRTFVQLFKIAADADRKPEIHLLDVRLPVAIATALEQSNGTLKAWEPESKQLTELREAWSKLPPYTEKTLNEHIYLDLKYVIAASDRYQTAIPQGERLPDVLDGSAFALHVLERYRPGRVPTDAPATITQVAGRTSIYALKANGKNGDRLDGRAVVRFAAVGAGSPVPLSFPSRVLMYRIDRLASS